MITNRQEALEQLEKSISSGQDVYADALQEFLFYYDQKNLVAANKIRDKINADFKEYPKIEMEVTR